MSLKYPFALALWAAVALFAGSQLGWFMPGAETLPAVAVSLILITLAGAWFAQAVDRRLQEIARAAAKIADGVEQVRVEVPREAEFSALGNAFNEMAKSVQRRITQLQASVQRNSAFAEHGPDAMWVFDVANFCLTEANESLTQMTGYARDELIGQNPVLLSAAVQENGIPVAEYARALISRVLLGKKVVAPWVVRTKAGREVLCELRAVRLPAPGSALICGSLMDITERRQAQDDLTYRMRFEALITRLSTDMIGVPPESADEAVTHALAEIGQFANVDRSYVFVFNEDKTQVSCTHEWCAPGIHPEIERLRELPVANFPWVEQRLQQGEVVHVPRVSETPPEARAEREEWQIESIQSLLLVPMYFGRDVPGYVGFDSVRAEKTWPDDSIALLKIFGEMVANLLHRRHTETLVRTQAEALSRANTELARSNEELQQFAFVASHDLQEPLRAISGFSSLLAKRYSGKLDAEADQHIHDIVESAARLQQLITDLLQYSRIQIRSRPFEPCATERTLARALSNLKTSVQELGAQVTHDPLPIVLGDAAQITQLLQNLIGNALKFHGETAPVIHIGARREAQGWHFFVRDNGIGIPRDEGQRVFEIFKRLHGSDRYPGSGIGLAICKRIVERHRGRIWVEPNPGGGSILHFTLPALESTFPLAEPTAVNIL